MAKKLWSVFSLLFLTLGAILLFWTNRYTVYDYLALRNYTPPVEIVKLANDDTFSAKAKNLFYVNKPQILDKINFSKQCKETEQTIVLGCYNGINIYLYKVDNKKLDGVEQVTAAHEMLHAAYSRLSPSEKTHIDKLTAEAFKNTNNPRIKELADSYNKQKPGSVPNELHSILATEVRDVGPELEQYYAKYFTNRIKIVEFSEKYERVFEDLKLQVEKYDADLALRKNEINKKENELEQTNKDLEEQKAQMDMYEANKQIKAYNAQVPIYNQKVSDYNYGVKELKRLIVEFNQIVETRNKVAVQQQDLASSIDSRLNTINN